MKRSLFAVMAIFGGLAAAQAQRSALDAIPGALAFESGTASGGFAPWMLRSREGVPGWRDFAPPVSPSSGIGRFRWSLEPSGSKSNDPSGTAALFFAGPLPDGGLWLAAGSFQSSSILTMSSFANPVLADGEFKALLSLIDGASLRSRTATAQTRWILGVYYVSAILLGFLVLIYLPWSSRPPLESPEGGQTP